MTTDGDLTSSVRVWLNLPSTTARRYQHVSARWSQSRRSAGGRGGGERGQNADNRGPRDRRRREAPTQAERTGAIHAGWNDAAGAGHGAAWRTT